MILVEGGRVYDHDGDTDHPSVKDVLIVDDRIVAVEPGIGARLAEGGNMPALADGWLDEVIDARDRLVLPGFVNAHYHSHDTLFKGAFEAIPLDFWGIYAMPPSYLRRSKEELRARTLIGAVECIRSGMTTVQDMDTIYPFHEDDLDVVLEAYEQVGLRCIFAAQFANVAKVAVRPYWEDLIPKAEQHRLGAPVRQFEDGTDIIEVIERTIKSRRGRDGRIGFGIGPASPEACTPALWERIAELSAREGLPIYTHIYQNKGMTLIGRHKYEAYGGSLIRFLGEVGALGPRLTLAHSVWLLPEEIDTLAETGTNVALNPVGNLKTRSGVAPMRMLLERGVNVGLGCDNCSCSDAQNMFQAMKLFVGLAGITHPDPGLPYSTDALRAATLGGARALGLEGEVGAVAPGMKADLTILDLSDVSFVPLTSAVRQIVFTEAGRSVETVIVDGRVVMRDRRILTIDETALRRSVEQVMVALRKDLGEVTERLAPIYDKVMEAHLRASEADLGVSRLVDKAT